MDAKQFLEVPPVLFTVSNRQIPRHELVSALATARGDVLKTAAALRADVSDVQNNRRRYRLLDDWRGVSHQRKAFARFTKVRPAFSNNDWN